MNLSAVRANRTKLLIMLALVVLCAAGYMLIEVNFANPKLFQYHTCRAQLNRIFSCVCC